MCKRKHYSKERDLERTELLAREHNTDQQNGSPCLDHKPAINQIWRNAVITLRMVGVLYVALGLVCFSIGLFLRTISFYSLLGPICILGVVLISSEYYNMKNNGWLRRCEEIKQKCFTKKGEN